MRDSMQEAATGFETSVNSEMQKTESELNAAVTGTTEAPVSPPPESATAIVEKQKQ
jgi:hypothetical protein